MEDIKQYIESGILELYVLGTLSPEEKFEVESMAAKYPAIKQELDEISKAMERFAVQNAIEPHESLRAKVLNQLTFTTTEPAASIPPKDNVADQKVIPLQPARTTQFYKYAFAASIALLLVSLAALFNTYNRLQESRLQLVALQLQNQKFANQVNFQQNQLDQKQSGRSQLPNQVKEDSISTQSIAQTHSQSQNQYLAKQFARQAQELKQYQKKLLALESQNKKVLGMVADPATRFIRLKGMPFSPSSSLLVAWNPEKNQLMINKKASTLPENDPEHQYQLWAIVKLKPVSLGVFDIQKADSLMETMTSVDRASAFAVTLEPRGGSEKPTMKQMMVMGFAHK